MRVILKEEIVQKLREVGLEKGDVVMVHTSLKRMGYVCGGAQTVIEALMEVVGENGTIMMPTQSWNRLKRTEREIQADKSKNKRVNGNIRRDASVHSFDVTSPRPPSGYSASYPPSGGE